MAQAAWVVRVMPEVVEPPLLGVESVQPITGADPEYSLAILVDGANGIAAQAVGVARTVQIVGDLLPCGILPVQSALRTDPQGAVAVPVERVDGSLSPVVKVTGVAMLHQFVHRRIEPAQPGPVASDPDGPIAVAEKHCEPTTGLTRRIRARGGMVE